MLAALLAEQGKLEWARQEFEAVRTAGPPAPRAEPWRRTSGIHKIRKPRALAAVRALWEARDRLAAERDIAPGRVLPDAAIVDAAAVAPTSLRRSRRCRCSAAGRSAGSPPTGTRRWRRRRVSIRPSSRRWRSRVTDRRPSPLGRPRPGRRRPARGGPGGIAAISAEWSIPAENLLQPDLLRRVCWSPPADGEVAAALREGGAREWQVELIAPVLADLARPVA